jgi:polygalacturonase
MNEPAVYSERGRVLLGRAVGVILLWMLAGETCAADTERPSRGLFNAREYGAIGDGTTLDTGAIQKTIDACAGAGGGNVYLQGGTFLSGTLVLKSNVTLYVEAGATLLGSRNMDDYPDVTPQIHYLYRPRFTKYMIYAEGAENIGIAGRGTIDGQGTFYTNPHGDKLRPYIVRFAECKNVRVTGVTFLNSARWLSHYLACEDVVIDGIKIRSRIRANRDGIGIDSCRWVRIANCHVFAGDDAIVLKANVRLHFAGGGTKEDAAREIPELEAAYPSGRVFGTLPALCRRSDDLGG